MMTTAADMQSASALLKSLASGELVSEVSALIKFTGMQEPDLLLACSSFPSLGPSHVRALDRGVDGQPGAG